MGQQFPDIAAGPQRILSGDVSADRPQVSFRLRRTFKPHQFVGQTYAQPATEGGAPGHRCRRHPARPCSPSLRQAVPGLGGLENIQRRGRSPLPEEITMAVVALGNHRITVHCRRAGPDRSVIGTGEAHPAAHPHGPELLDDGCACLRP